MDRSRMRNKHQAVKDKRASDVQVTAAQIIAEAKMLEPEVKQETHLMITDPKELELFREHVRQRNEEKVKRGFANADNWVNYAKWEEQQHQFDKSRSVFERGLENHPMNRKLWREYAEMEMRQGNINRARNIFHRAISAMPQEDELWMKYALLEQAAMDDQKARDVFARWLQFLPGPHAYKLAVKFEIARCSYDRAREILAQFVMIINEPDSWLFYAAAERAMNDVGRARKVLETAIEALPQPFDDGKIHTELADICVFQNDIAAARQALISCLEQAPAHVISSVFPLYSRFERQHGTLQDIDFLCLQKLKDTLEKTLQKNPRNYSVWARYIAAEQQRCKLARENPKKAVDELLNRAVQHPPESKGLDSITDWAAFGYLCIERALALEQDDGDVEEARKVFKVAISGAPHSLFCFEDLWIQAANLELRHNNLQEMRKLLGAAWGSTGSIKIFRHYVAVERSKGELDRVRKLYESFLQKHPQDVSIWVEYANFEAQNSEPERADGLFQLAVATLPQCGAFVKEAEVDKVWGAFIAARMRAGNLDGVRQLYDTLLDEALGKYAATATPIGGGNNEDEEDNSGRSTLFARLRNVLTGVEQFEMKQSGVAGARAWYKKAVAKVRSVAHGNLQFVAPLLTLWRKFESHHGTAESLRAVDEAMEAPIKKRSRLFKMAEGHK